jgi:hypothetical protein
MRDAIRERCMYVYFSVRFAEVEFVDMHMFGHNMHMCDMHVK